MAGESRRDDGRGVGLHVALFPFFAFGHISPYMQLAKRLAAHGVKVSFLSAPANVPRTVSLLSSSAHDAGAAAVDVVPLEFPAIEGLPPGIQSTAEATPAMAELLRRAADLMQPQVESFLANARPHAVFHDFAHPWLPSVAHPLGVRTLHFVVFAAAPAAFLTVPSRRRPCLPDPWQDCPSLVRDVMSPPAGFPSPPVSTIDAVPLYQAAALSYVFKSFNGVPSVYDQAFSCISHSSAVVIKTCREMEASYLDYLEAEYKKPMLLAGLLPPDPPTGKLEAKWSGWLDRFPAGSVIYCSFGSESFLTDECILELAHGLDSTGLPFFLVLNFPKDSGAADEDAVDRLRRKLPEGFEERARGRGVVHSGWVQQQHILAHPSVGCFLCHAGMSSVMEGLMGGCELVLLPQKGDQFLNARLFGGDLRAAVEVPRREADGWFTREDVRESLRKVMVETEEEPGRTVRENSRRWREFLLDGEVHRRYTAELVGKLREMVGF